MLVAFGVLFATLVTACLGPTEFDPTGDEPIGSLDVIHVAGSSVRVVGWAIDPNTTSPVVVSVGFGGRTFTTRADVTRADVGAAFPGYGSRHGFDFTTPSLGTERMPVCVWVENVGPGGRGRLLGCHTMTPVGDDADGRFDAFTTIGDGRGRLVGWALEPEIPHKPITVEWSLNGGDWKTAPTDVVRDDINRTFATTGTHGFSVDIDLVRGSNRVCMRVPAWGRGSGANMGCRTVTHDVASPITTGLDLLTVFRVGPPDGHALVAMSRDAGVSTVLGDGSVMWFFGDSFEFDEADRLKYFVNNTSAWASRAVPHQTVDAISANGTAVESFTPPVTPAFSPSCPANWKPVHWPLSAVTVPTGSGTDEVFVYLANVCLGTGEMQMSGRGISVAGLTYDPERPPGPDRPVDATIITQNLFPTSAPTYGTAAVFRPDPDGVGEGFIHVYQCGRPANDGTTHWPNDPDYGPCTVGRVRPSDIGDAGSYEFFRGQDHEPPSEDPGDPEVVLPPIDDDRFWDSDPSSAGAMEIPVEDGSVDKELPVAAFTIVQDPHHGYVMAYSPWPGFTKEIALRRSDSPIGPWSEQYKYRLPGCEDTLGGKVQTCYAGTPQPFLSTEDRVGIGYYDQLVGLKPTRGSYLAGTVARLWPSRP